MCKCEYGCVWVCVAVCVHGSANLATWQQKLRFSVTRLRNSETQQLSNSATQQLSSPATQQLSLATQLSNSAERTPWDPVDVPCLPSLNLAHKSKPQRRPTSSRRTRAHPHTPRTRARTRTRTHHHPPLQAGAHQPTVAHGLNCPGPPRRPRAVLRTGDVTRGLRCGCLNMGVRPVADGLRVQSPKLPRRPAPTVE